MLGFGKRVGALELDRVLGGEDDKRGRQRVRLAVDRHPTFLHGFQKRRLRFGRGAIDFVGKQDVDEDGALPKLELCRLGIEHAGPDDIARHQVRGELDTSIVECERLGERPHQERLCDPGDAFEQHVSIREHRHQRLLHGLLLACDRLTDFGTNRGAELLHPHAGEDTAKLRPPLAGNVNQG